MPSCAIATCKNVKNSVLSCPGIIFHRFPKESQTRKQWISRCFRKDRFNPDTARICSEHFLPSDYQNDRPSKITQLNKSAIPTENLPFSKPNLEISSESSTEKSTNSDCKENNAVHSSLLQSSSNSEIALNSISQSSKDENRYIFYIPWEYDTFF